VEEERMVLEKARRKRERRRYGDTFMAVAGRG